MQSRALHGRSVAELPDVTVENEESVAMHRNLAALFQKLLRFCRRRRARWRWKSTTSPTPIS